MVMRKGLGLLVLLLIAALASNCDGPTSDPSPQSVSSSGLSPSAAPIAIDAVGQPQLLASGVDVQLAHPIAYEHTVFWPRFKAGTSIYGYDIDASRYFTVTEDKSIKSSIISNGEIVAWVEGDSEAGSTAVRAHDLVTGKESLPMGTQQVATGLDTSGIALDGNRLYYEAKSIYMHDLAAGNDRLIGTGRNPVAADGLVLWGDRPPATPTPTETPLPTTAPGAPTPTEDDSFHMVIGYAMPCDIHLAQPATRPGDKIIGVADIDSGESCGGEMAEFSISGHRVVWTPSYLAAGAIYIYDVTTGHSENIVHNATVSRPVLKGDILVWTEGPTGGGNGPNGWSVHARNLTTGAEWTVVPENGNAVQQSWAIAGNKLIYTVHSYYNEQADLYITDLEPGK